MNSFVCWLTGGHRYSDANLTVYTDPKTDEFVFQNYCVKCHKPFIDKVARIHLIGSIYDRGEQNERFNKQRKSNPAVLP